MLLLLDNSCEPPCDPGLTCVDGTCLNTGFLSTSLVWSRAGDGDIVLTTPNAKSIYWANKGPSKNTDEGDLDTDDQVGTGPENIYWPSTGSSPPTGIYYVCFQPYAFSPLPSVQNPVTATVTVRRRNSTTVLTFTKIVTEKYYFDNTCTSSVNGLVGTFNYP